MTRGWQWPLFIGAIILVGFAGTGMLILRSAGDPSFAVEPDYYAKGMKWDETARQRALLTELGWSVQIALQQSPEAAGFPLLVIRIDDAAGEPVADMRVDAMLFHHLSAKDRHVVPLSPDGPGVWRASVPSKRPGLWRILLRIDGDAGEMEHEADVELGLASEGPRS